MFGWFKGEEKPKVDPSQFHKPEHYRGDDGPEFRVLESKPNEYEVREYRKTHWAQTRGEGGELRACVRQCFSKLSNYTGGSNDAGVKIASSKPFRVIVEKDEDGNPKAVTLAFFVPVSDPDGKPPAPKDDTITLVSDEARVMYARAFSGFAKDGDWEANLAQLKEALRRDGKGFTGTPTYRAGHDPPFRLTNRHNEVWLIADPQPALDDAPQE